MCLFATCTRLQFNDKLIGQIAQNRCYVVVFFFIFCAVGVFFLIDFQWVMIF